MRFSSNYASVPPVTSKGKETKRDSPCIMIFALNSIVLFDAFQKIRGRTESFTSQSRKHLCDNNVEKDFSRFREILILIELQSTAVSLKQCASEIYRTMYKLSRFRRAIISSS